MLNLTLTYGGLGPRPRLRYRTKPVSLREHVLSAGRTAAVTLTWRAGSKGNLTSQFVILAVRMAGRKPHPATDGSLPISHLIAQWPPSESEPIKYWLSNLPDRYLGLEGPSSRSEVDDLFFHVGQVD